MHAKHKQTNKTNKQTKPVGISCFSSRFRGGTRGRGEEEREGKGGPMGRGGEGEPRGRGDPGGGMPMPPPSHQTHGFDTKMIATTGKHITTQFEVLNIHLYYNIS